MAFVLLLYIPNINIIINFEPGQIGNIIISLKGMHPVVYIHMPPERLKCAFREAPQRHPLLDNSSLGTYPQQRIGSWAKALLRN
jgi:hypothetical protein